MRSRLVARCARTRRGRFASFSVPRPAVKMNGLACRHCPHAIVSRISRLDICIPHSDGAISQYGLSFPSSRFRIPPNDNLIPHSGSRNSLLSAARFPAWVQVLPCSLTWRDFTKSPRCRPNLWILPDRSSRTCCQIPVFSLFQNGACFRWTTPTAILPTPSRRPPNTLNGIVVSGVRKPVFAL